MIIYLKGELKHKEPTRAVVEIGGIGWEVLIPMSTFDKLPRINDVVQLKTYLYVREDNLLLYGFYSELERQLFQLLISSVSRIGPKIGLNILSTLSVESFCHAVMNDDIRALSRINGIGQRSAERLLIEVKDKIRKLMPQVVLKRESDPKSAQRLQVIEDAINALITLGFNPDRARKSVLHLAKEMNNKNKTYTAESLIRQSLVLINK